MAKGWPVTTLRQVDEAARDAATHEMANNRERTHSPSWTSGHYFSDYDRQAWCVPENSAKTASTGLQPYCPGWRINGPV